VKQKLTFLFLYDDFIFIRFLYDDNIDNSTKINVYFSRHLANDLIDYS